MKKIYFSIDFEDISHDLGRFLKIDNKDLRSREDAVWTSYSIISEFIKNHLNDIKITFFCTGILAKLQPKIIKTIANDGHEIACHYYFHDLVNRDDVNIFESNIKKAINTLEDVSNSKVLGFRAPSWSINYKDIEHYKVIAKYFKYDSSLVISSFCEVNELKKNPEIENLIFFPVVSKKIYPLIPRLHFGGTYLKLFGASNMKKLLDHSKTEQMIPIIYMHPYEFMNDKSFYLSWKELSSLNLSKRIYWYLKQMQWHSFGNKNVINYLSNIHDNHEPGGKLNSLLKY